MKNTISYGGASASVVGGGIVGLCVALSLQRQGMAVTLIDPVGDPRGASWGNAGHLATEQAEPLASAAMLRSVGKRLFPRGPVALPVRDIVAWAPFALRLVRFSTPQRFVAGRAALGALLHGAIPAWRRLAEDAGARDMIVEDGHFVAWERSAGVEAARARWRMADTGPAILRDATSDELAAIGALAPGTRIAGAIRFAGSGQVRDPGLLAEALRARFAALGGRLRMAQVDRIELRDGAARAMIDGEAASGDLVVLTAGFASGALLRPLGVRAPIIAERGYHIQSPLSEWPATMPPVAFEDRSMIVTRFDGGLRAAGFVEFGRAGSVPDRRKWEALRAHVRELGLPFAMPGSEWMGVRPTLPDYLPAIGRARRAHNLLYAFGHQHLGLTLAAITGEHVAAMALGEAPDIDMAPYAIERFGSG